MFRYALRPAFTLVELLVVVGIIALLLAILLPTFSGSREFARKAACFNNLQQIAKILEIYADDYSGKYPLAWKLQLWGQEDGPGPDEKAGWMWRIYPYIKQVRAYKCPSFPRKDDQFNYFLGTRAEYAYRTNMGYPRERRRGSVRRSMIEYPAAFVLGGDCNYKPFDIMDCDRDDYSQNCLGWWDTLGGKETNEYWLPYHNRGLNVIFADGHVSWFDRYEPGLMTFSYDDYTDWYSAIHY